MPCKADTIKNIASSPQPATGITSGIKSIGETVYIKASINGIQESIEFKDLF